MLKEDVQVPFFLSCFFFPLLILLVPLGGPSAPWRPTGGFGRPSLQTAPPTVAGRTPTAGAYVPPHKTGRPGFDAEYYFLK